MAQNIGYYAQTPYGLFPYTAPLALDKLGIQIAMLGKVTQQLGIEIFHTRYNIGLLRLLWQIDSDGIETSNYSASSSASVDKDVLNLKSDITEQYWQSTGLSEWFQFDVGLNKTSSMDTFALISTNLTTSAVIKIYAYGSGSSAAPVSWSEAYLYATIPAVADPLERNRIWISPTLPATTYRHWRVTITDTTNTDGFIRVGRAIGGSSLIFTTENCLDAVNFKRENYKDEFKINGFTSIANNRAFKKTMTLNFKNLNRLQYVNYKRLMTYCDYCRDTLKALVIIDPQEPYIFSVFAKLKSLPEESHTYVSADTSNVDLSLSYDEAR